MPICSACGRESPDGFQHCGFCGASLSAPVVERRILATLVFCDLSGSTALGERVDAESVTELLRSYFQEMRTVIERHGGIVEKFIGDAVVAAFGVREVHEDDALRACRAALEMQQRMVDLNAGHEQRFGTRIAARIGVNTGEVVAGGGMGAETFAIGDAVNVAARLEQAAAPGEILLGEPTFRLVRDAVRVEAVEPLSAKGKSQPVEAYRLISVGDVGSAPSPRLGTPFAGRDDELRLLECELESTVAERRCRLVTILGEPGVGKSRLVAEFLARVGASDARIARGRCLPYGEGITFWAVGEVVRDLAGIRDEHSVAEAHALVSAHLAGAANASVLAAKVAQLLGLADGVATAEETAWAIRAFLTSSRGSGPLVILVEDIHWAEPALLDLLAGLEAAAIDSPVLLVCPARPELLEHRPSWEVAVRLEPLGARDVDTLLTGMLGATPETVRLRLAHASAGNPLFAEEMVAMLLDDGALRLVDGACTVDGDLAAFALPASLHAILAARLDRLGVDERAAVERAAVEGEVFHRGAVEELSEPAPASVAQSLDALTRKNLVRPADAVFTGETAFRFKHILVRDVAYRTTTKRLRAVFHEQFAAWLERVAGDRVVQYEEILGHHLEQAHGLRVELGLTGEETGALGERAARRLASGGRRAVARGDRRAAVNLLRRAAALIPERSRDRVEVAIDLVEPLAGLGMFAEAEALADEAAETAVALGDECIAARVDVERTWLAVYAQVDDFAVASALDHTSAAMAVFERAGDDVGLARAQELVAMVHYYYGGLSEAALASEQGLVHAERAHDLQRQAQHRLVRMHSAQGGFTPLGQVNDLLVDDLDWARQTGSLEVEAKATMRLSAVRGALGDPTGRDELFARGTSACSELGLDNWAAGFNAIWIWGLTDDPAVAEARLRASYDLLAVIGPRKRLSTVAAILSDCVYRQGRDEEAEAMLDEAADAADDDDLMTQVRLRTGRARLLAKRGNGDEAVTLAREGVALAGETEYVYLRGDSLLALAEVFEASGRLEEAADAIREALSLWKAKGAIASERSARRRLDELGES